MRVHRVTPTRLALDPIGEFDSPVSDVKSSWTQYGVTERIRFYDGGADLARPDSSTTGKTCER